LAGSPALLRPSCWLSARHRERRRGFA
jgi:hypothetical protein